MSKVKNFLASPFVVMALVIAMYSIKAVVKVSLGTAINSPVIAGDGWHNLADILEALAVIAVIWVARLPSSKSYPFGRKNIEFFSGFAIGLALIFMGCRFALQSVVGLVALSPGLDAGLRQFIWLPAHEALVMTPALMPVVLAVTGLSVLASLAVSRYQVAVGKSSGHASLIADGEETASDGRIELVAFIGISCEYLFNIPWLEYPLGLVVAFLVARTGCQLASSAWKVLLQHSLGSECEAAITGIAGNVPGVCGLGCLKTFRVGHTAVVLLTVETRRNASTCQFIKYGLEERLSKYLLAAGFKSCDLHIKFAKPDPQRYRVAFVLRQEKGMTAVAGTLAEATHVVVCDVEHDTIVRARKDDVPAPQDVSAFVRDKRISVLYVFHPERETVVLSPDCGCRLEAAVAYHPSVLGLERVTG